MMISATAPAAGLFTFEFEELSDGVWAGVRPDAPRYPVMGNTTFVVGDNGVVVFDGGGMPLMSEQLIRKIRSVTDKPVTHVVMSHWHGDHLFGVYRFAEEYPGVQFVAHEYTRDIINSSRISYIDRQVAYIENNLEEFRNIVETGIDADGNEHTQADRDVYQRIIADRDEILPEFRRARVTPPDIVFTDRHDIDLGNRVVQLRFLGHANTAGDVVMWLPEERILASGDIVVLPSPYAFNVPPRKWTATLRAIKALDYAMLVPGHGAVQTVTDYVDLLIEMAESIAQQRDELLATGMSNDEVEAALDFSAFEERFTHGDAYLQVSYHEWFVTPFRAAAMKALSGEPMVPIPPPESVPFDDERWNIEAAEYEIADYLGQKALKIKGGGALLPGLDIRNGLIEFDVAITEQRGFAGVVFRLQDDNNYENFYIRPHQSGNPDANQYQPVYNGVASWQLYYGAEYAAPVEYRYNEWMPVKIVYAGGQADVYIDSEEPVLHIDRLRREQPGGAIGLSSANFSAVHFANFHYTQLADAYAFPATPAREPTPNVISRWQVSDAFPAAMLAGAAELDGKLLAARTWQALDAEPDGITNLARVNGVADDADTAFALVKLEANEAETKQLALGFSDKAAVYLNGQLIYKGDNTYLSRDYRYLGTIGFFDNVILPLRKGENELCIAVTEAFGGWGVMGKITDP
jgi:glyoxylase-like metal-dependent hydrolase (beta-lactamase superfamily II)